MKEVNVKIKKTDERAVIPEYKHPHEDACFDISVLIDNDKMCPMQVVDKKFGMIEGYRVSADSVVNLRPHESMVFHTGLSFEIPTGFAMKIHVRSSTGIKNHCILSNATGVIDSNYRGEVLISLTNLSEEHITISNHDRIAQGEITEVITAVFSEVNDLSDTTRGEGGFGSTGTK